MFSPVSIQVSKHRFPDAYNRSDTFPDFHLFLPVIVTPDSENQKEKKKDESDEKVEKVEKRILYCHRVFLAMKSPFWNKLFTRHPSMDKLDMTTREFLSLLSLDHVPKVHCDTFGVNFHFETMLLSRVSPNVALSIDNGDVSVTNGIKAFETMIKSYYTGEISEIEPVQLIDEEQSVNCKETLCHRERELPHCIVFQSNKGLSCGLYHPAQESMDLVTVDEWQPVARSMDWLGGRMGTHLSRSSHQTS